MAAEEAKDRDTPAVVLVGKTAPKVLVNGTRWRTVVSQPAEAAGSVREEGAVAVVFLDGQGGSEECAAVRRVSRTAFIAVMDKRGCEDGAVRLEWFASGCNMVSTDGDTIAACVTKVVSHAQCGGTLQCPTCGLPGLTPQALCAHHPLHHIYAPNHAAKCPICRRQVGNVAVHLHDRHGAHGGVEGGRPHIALFAFALVVVRRPSDGKFLLVQEFAEQGFWLPGGGVDAMERLVDGGVRETLEEGGIHVVPKGIIKVEFKPKGQPARGEYWARLRAIVYAEPADEKELPKTVPDFESAGAVWASYAEIQAFQKAGQLRGWEPVVYCGHVHDGAPIFPLSVLDG